MKFEKKNNGEVATSFVADCAEIFDINPLIMEQIILRGNDTVEKISEFLNPSPKSFHNPFDLKNMQELVNRIKKAVNAKEKILVFGDYDVDGISATAIMLKTLRIMGANPKFYLPNRYIDGYGLTNEVILKIKEEFAPQVIITVDCGISCHDEVEFAKTLGIEILVTDHHEIPDVLPNTIVVNAKLPDQKYGFNGLCGTGLAYKIACALIGDDADFLLPIATIATIADIVPLVDENRAIVYFGLKNLKNLPIGLKLLFKNLGIDINNCSANEISFKVSPKINASGRMGDAKDSLKLYLSENIGEIKIFINKILNHNNNRRDLCSLVETDCDDILAKTDMSAPSIILSSKDWDQGILGIICAKLVGEYNRPVFLFTEVDGIMKGSARSTSEINIHKLLSSMQDILDSFGGHPVAAGLTLKVENFDNFIMRVNDYLLENYSSDIFVPKEFYDIEINTTDLNTKFLQDLKKIEPTGCDNESLKFYIKATNFSFSPMKNYYVHCNLKIAKTLNLVSFNCADCYEKIKKAKELDIIFTLQFDSFNKNFKGIVKTFDANPTSFQNISKSVILSKLEQLKYVGLDNSAKYKIIDNKKENFNLNSYFGTAFVVNSDDDYQKFLELVDTTRILKSDVEVGEENSGLNAIFINPKSIEFARVYKKIIFFSNVEKSYIGKINQISNAEILVLNPKLDKKYYQFINMTRENFGEIYKNLKRTNTNFNSYLDLFFVHKNKFKAIYSYKDFYSALLVFQELKLITINRINGKYFFDINSTIKVDLNNSKIYNAILGLKEIQN